MSWFLLLLFLVPLLGVVAPSINYRLTIWDAVGTSKANLINLAAASHVAASFTNIDINWAQLAAAGYVDNTMVAPVSRVKLEQEDVPGFPLANATAESYWGLIVC